MHFQFLKCMKRSYIKFMTFPLIFIWVQHLPQVTVLVRKFTTKSDFLTVSERVVAEV